MATATEPLTLNPELTAGIRLEVSKTIRAPRSRVFAAWTDPAILQQWFGPEGMNCAATEVDLRVGGAYRIEMAADDKSRVSIATGEYLQIIPDQLLEFTWEGCWRKGEVSIVRVTLLDSAATPNATDVTILHHRIAADDSAAGYERGWTGSLAKLAALFNR